MRVVAGIALLIPAVLLALGTWAGVVAEIRALHEQLGTGVLVVLVVPLLIAVSALRE